MPPVGGNTEALGRTLYTSICLPFEVVSLVLTVGVIGAIVLAMPERLGREVGESRARSPSVTRAGPISLFRRVQPVKRRSLALLVTKL